MTAKQVIWGFKVGIAATSLYVVAKVPSESVSRQELGGERGLRVIPKHWPTQAACPSGVPVMPSGNLRGVSRDIPVWFPYSFWEPPG